MSPTPPIPESLWKTVPPDAQAALVAVFAALRCRVAEFGYRPDCCVFMLQAIRRLPGQTCDGSGCSVLGLRRVGWATKTSFGNSSAHIRTKEVSAFHGRIRAKMTSVSLVTTPLPQPFLIPRLAPGQYRGKRVLEHKNAAIWAVPVLSLGPGRRPQGPGNAAWGTGRNSLGTLPEQAPGPPGWTPGRGAGCVFQLGRRPFRQGGLRRPPAAHPGTHLSPVSQ